MVRCVLVFAVCELAKVAVGILCLGMFFILRSAFLGTDTTRALCLVFGDAYVKFDLFDPPSRAGKFEGGARRPISLRGSPGQTVEKAISMFLKVQCRASVSSVASWLVLRGCCGKHSLIVRRGPCLHLETPAVRTAATLRMTAFASLDCRKR